MYEFKNIINLEKKKLFSKFYFSNFKKEYIKTIIIGEGCNGFKFKFKKINNLKKKEILIIKKNLKFLVDFMSYNLILNSKFIKNKKKILIKNKFIKNFCNCGESFNLKI